MSNSNNTVIMNLVANATATNAGNAAKTPMEHMRDAVNAQAKKGAGSSVA